jgi:hypothetical protein
MSDADLNLQLDSWSMITEGGGVGIAGGGGDSCNRTCVYLTCESWEGYPQGSWFSKTLSYIVHPWFPGLGRRHPDPTQWYSQWNRMSRDQMIPLLIAMGEYGCWPHAAWWTIGQALRAFLFATNTRNDGATAQNNGQSNGNGGTYDYSWKLPDLTGPDVWALEIRALPWQLGIFLYPLLMVFDLYILGGAIYLRWFDTDDTDVINHVMTCIWSERKLATPWILLTNKFVNKASDLQARMTTFFSYPTQPRMDLVLQPFVTRYFK